MAKVGLESEEVGINGKLPLHMLMNIFTNLQLSDKKNASLVCVYWCNILSIGSDLRPPKMLLTDETFRSICLTTLPREYLEIRNLRCDLAVSNRRNNWIQEIKSIKFVTGTQGTSATNLLKVLQNALKLERLGLEAGAVEFNPATHGLALLRLENLKHLTIETFTKDHGTIGAIGSLLKATFPRLQAFNLRFIKEPKSKDITHDQFVKVYTDIYGFLGRHTESLREVILIKPKQLRNIGEGPVLPTDIHPKLLKLNLRCFEVYTGEYETVYSMDSSLVEGSTELRKISLTGFPIRPPFAEVIRRNANAIEELKWQSRNPPSHGGPPTTFDIETIASSKKLKSLVVESSIVFNLQRTPVSITELVLKSCSVDATQFTWIANNLYNLKSLVYLQNMTAEVFFVPMDLNSIQYLLMSLPLEKIGAYCGGNLGAVRHYVQETEGLEEVEQNDPEPGTIYFVIRRW